MTFETYSAGLHLMVNGISFVVQISAFIVVKLSGLSLGLDELPPSATVLQPSTVVLAPWLLDCWALQHN